MFFIIWFQTSNQRRTLGSRLEVDVKCNFTRQVGSQISLAFSVFLQYRTITFLLRLRLMRICSASDTDLNKQNRHDMSTLSSPALTCGVPWSSSWGLLPGWGIYSVVEASLCPDFLSFQAKVELDFFSHVSKKVINRDHWISFLRYQTTSTW